MPVAIIGGTGDGLAATTPVVPSGVDREVRATSVIYPDAIAVISPAVALCAGGTAALVGHLHTAACIDGAVMPPAIIRRTGDGLLRPNG